MPIQKDAELTTEELRNRWVIGLECGMFKPSQDYLRSLFLGNKFEYRHSPLGVLCVVSNLGEFIPDRDNFSLEKAPRHPLRHFYQLKDRPTHRAQWKEDLYTPPRLILERVDIFPRWAKTYREMYRLNMFEIPDHLESELQSKSTERYLAKRTSINTILYDTAIPEYRRLPIIGELLRHKIGNNQ